ncbi:MAG TPA: hypothetical protein VHB50_11310 [Bryobacteraceae bacterium]|nr:hypothetical protein [Bryobacteraceae bacterium]
MPVTRRGKLLLAELFGLAALPALSPAQISLIHVTSCGPQTLPLSSCAVPSTGAGHLLVVGIQLGAGVNTSTRISGITDNAGNTYAEAGSSRSVDATAGAVADIWYAKSSKSGATSLTISLADSSTTEAVVSNAGAVIWEFSGADAAAPFDRAAVLNSQPSSATPAGASVSTSGAEAVVSLLATSGNVTGISTGNSFTNDSLLKGDGWAHMIAAAAGPLAARWNQSPAGSWASSTASFKAAGSAVTSSALNACDLNQDGAVNVVDVQLATNMYLGLTPCAANIAGAGVCSAAVVQQVQTAALTGACAATVSHSVSLNWTASITPGVTYNVYRSTTSSGPWTKVSASPVAVTTFSDNSVASARTYYYATTAVDGSGKESAYSNVATAVIP